MLNMRNNNSNFVTGLLKDLRKTSRCLKEAYIFDDEEPNESDMEYGTPNDFHHSSMRDDRQNQGGEQMRSAEEEDMHAQEVIQHEPIIGKIREIAIEGLRKYADHPTSSIYEFMKKVFLEADKVLSDNDGKK